MKNERELKIEKLAAALRQAGEREFRIVWAFVSKFLEIR
jgi:hypothetical protein